MHFDMQEFARSHAYVTSPRDVSLTLPGVTDMMTGSVSSVDPPKRRRLLSELEAPTSLQPHACSVDDVLQLLQLLYAISKDSSMDSNLLGKSIV